MKNKRDKKNDKKHLPRRNKSITAPTKQAPTQRGQIIASLMTERKVKGNYKDYVLILNHVLIDWLGEYNMSVIAEGDEIKRATINGMALIHKSRLAAVLGEQVGNTFWKLGMRTNFGVEARRVGCVRAKVG